MEDIEDTSVVVPSSEHNDPSIVNLSHLSDSDRFQLTAVHTGKEAASQTADGSMQLSDLTAGESQDGLENVLLCPDMSDVSSMDDQGQLAVEDEASGSYVDVKIKEGQIIRLKVPYNIDPVAYAAEYLQHAINVEGVIP